MSRRRKILIVALALGVITIASCVTAFYVVVANSIARIRQDADMRDFVAWESEYAKISTSEAAKLATELLERLRYDSLPRGGFRHDPAKQSRLEAQRRRTIDVITNALEEFKRQQSVETTPEMP